MEKQTTIKKMVEISGIGLHTGMNVKLRFHPAPVDSWAVFWRSDIGPDAKVKAIYENAIGEHKLGTILEKDEAKVQTVEHVLAAISALDIDNILIELDGPEPPVLDGSAKPFVDLLQEAGIVEQNTKREYFVVRDVIEFHEPNRPSDIHVIPFDGLRITAMIDFPEKPALSTQYTTMQSKADFPFHFAPARTFCFLSDVERMLSEGFIKGGNPDNALVVVDKEFTKEDEDFLRKNFQIEKDAKLFGKKDAFLNNVKQRFYNEPVRHKVVDMMGDIRLLGFPMKGHIIAGRPGHPVNVALVKRIQKQHDKLAIARSFGGGQEGVQINVDGIEKILPHRYPFLLVDRMVDFEEGKWAMAIKNVTANEPFFQGHFPGHPIMPGVLIVEAMAQTGGFLLLNAQDMPENNVVYFLGIDKVRFRKPVLPGDQLKIRVEMVTFKRGLCKFKGMAYVGDNLVCEGEFMASLAEKE
ncbi:MAG: bifunctional UDP-3-O-[3-hydroxymyristoyl] N-acetylglucosamine deacetylase/3-hydroxyacyl-ACP dehydratase [Candidatus Zixiibacteriota bacterium]